MLICEPPVVVAARSPVVSDTQQWNVTVIDSTKSPQGKGDTRFSSGGTPGQGVGRGVIRIYTNADGAVAGYCWSDGGKSKFEPQDERNLVIGRWDVAARGAEQQAYGSAFEWRPFGTAATRDVRPCRCKVGHAAADMRFALVYRVSLW